MPVLNGYDATQQYRSSEDPDTHIPIIAVTANTMPGDKEKCIASGMDDYIEKPVASDILKKTVRHWLSEVL
jgi:CheY-like chemotaxis protein